MEKPVTWCWGGVDSWLLSQSLSELGAIFISLWILFEHLSFMGYFSLTISTHSQWISMRWSCTHRHFAEEMKAWSFRDGNHSSHMAQGSDSRTGPLKTWLCEAFRSRVPFSYQAQWASNKGYPHWGYDFQGVVGPESLGEFISRFPKTELPGTLQGQAWTWNPFITTLSQCPSLI
jgi:hypothetical protein